jgi:hypothetical protein
MDLQRPLFDSKEKQEKERKERRKNFSPLPSAVFLLSLSERRISLSLSGGRTHSSEIDPRSRTMTMR